MPKKSKTENPLLEIINHGAVDLVVAPSLELIGRFGMRVKARRETLISQHLTGVQRVGIVPSIGTMDTHFLVVQFLPCPDDFPGDAMRRALRFIAVLHQEHLVFETLAEDPDKMNLMTTTYDVPVSLEYHADMKQDVFQLWFLFDRELDRGKTWLTIQALLLSAGFDVGARILPFPHYRTKQHVEDLTWLPYFGGGQTTVQGRLMGGVRDGRTVMLNTRHIPPHEIPVLPLLFDEISHKEFERLQEIAEPYLVASRAMIPPLPASSAPIAEANPGSVSADQTTAESGFFRAEDQQDSNGAVADGEVDRKDGRAAKRRAWQSILENVRKDIESAGFFSTGLPLDKDFDMFRPILQSRVFQFPLQFLRLWRAAVEEVLGVDRGWVDDLVAEAFANRELGGSNLDLHLRRATAAGLSEIGIARFMIKWLASNGGQFIADRSGCTLSYSGEDYPIISGPPFSVLIWKLSKGSGVPLLMTVPVYETMLNEVLSLITVTPTKGAAPVATVSASALARPTTVLVEAIRKMFDMLTGPDSPGRKTLEQLVRVDRSPNKIEVVGSGSQVLTALVSASGSRMDWAVPVMRAAMIKATDELSAMGVTWDETSPGKGMRKVFHIVRSV